jgi:hypothetical protein
VRVSYVLMEIVKGFELRATKTREFLSVVSDDVVVEFVGGSVGLVTITASQQRHVVTRRFVDERISGVAFEDLHSFVPFEVIFFVGVSLFVGSFHVFVKRIKRAEPFFTLVAIEILMRLF